MTLRSYPANDHSISTLGAAVQRSRKLLVAVGVAIAPDGAKAYVTNYATEQGDNIVSVPFEWPLFE